MYVHSQKFRVESVLTRTTWYMRFEAYRILRCKIWWVGTSKDKIRQDSRTFQFLRRCLVSQSVESSL